MSDYLIYGNVDTRSYNVYIFPFEIDDVPQINQQKVTVPGKHGSLLYEGRTFENVQHRYMGVAYSTAYRSASGTIELLRNALMKYDSYVRLTDTFHQDEFYMARYVGGLEPKWARGRDMVKFIIEFDRMPQRFLTSGEDSVTISGSSTLTNPTNFPSNPLIRAYGQGAFMIAGKSLSISSSSPYSYIDIDCEMKDCYNGSMNCNQYVSFQNHQFPVLRAGSNSISCGGSNSLVVTPRWWRV